MENPLVAIWMVTFNHEKFISQAIEGVLFQKTNFEFKLFIGEDCSTDRTREICMDYKNKFPKQVEVICTSENNIILNSDNIFKACYNSGAKYVAMCEGDDYWTDSNKLQIQIDFLEKNMSFVGCFHNTEERYEDDPNKPSFLYCNFNSSKAIDFQSLAYQNLIPTCSVVFARNLLAKFPDWQSKLKMGDWPIHLLNAQYGDYWYIPWVMAVHRLHSKSTWMLQDSELNKKFTIDAYDTMIKGFETKSEFQGRLICAKEAFINPPKHRQLSLTRRGVNYIKRLIRR
jgi:glycosyltransferase involved in cell wall biosynthesis